MIGATLRLIAGDRALRLIALAIFAYGSFIASLAPYQSLIAIEHFGLSDRQFALVFTCGATLSLLAALGVGILSDRTAKRRNAARLAASAGLAGALLVFLTDARWAYVLVHVLFFPLAMTLFGQLFVLARLATTVHPEGARHGVQSTIRAVFALPFILVLPGWSLAFGLGADLLWLYAALAGSAGLTLAIFVFAWPRDGRTRWTDTASGLSIRAALAELAAPPVLARAAVLGAINAGIQIYMILNGLILNGAEGRGPGDVALFAGLVAGLEVPFMLLGPRLIARFGLSRMISGAAVLYAGFLAVFPLAGPHAVVWLLALPAAMGASVILTAPLIYLQNLMGARPGAGGSLIALVGLAGQVIAAGVFALGSGLGGYGTVAGIGTAMLLAAALLLRRLDRAAEGPAAA